MSLSRALLSNKYSGSLKVQFVIFCFFMISLELPDQFGPDLEKSLKSAKYIFSRGCFGARWLLFATAPFGRNIIF